MRRTFAVVALAVVTMALSGCGPRDYEYVRPNLPSQAAAFIADSKLRNPDALRPDTNVYLVAVDGKLIGPHGLNDRTILAPGPHAIRFGVRKASLVSGDAWGFGDTQLIAEAGKIYTLRATEPAGISAFCSTSTGWLESEDGTPASDKVPVMIARFTGGVMMVSHTHCPPR